MCYRPIHLHKLANGFIGHDVPCGKCPECQEMKKLSYCFRNFFEYDRVKGHALFCTLTHAPENLSYADVMPELTELPIYRIPHSCFNDVLLSPDEYNLLKDDVALPKYPFPHFVMNNKVFRFTCWNKSEVQSFLKKLNEHLQNKIIRDIFHVKRTKLGELNPCYKTLRKIIGRPLGYFLTCERGKADVYVDDNGKTRTGCALPHYHVILFNRVFNHVPDDYILKIVDEFWTNGRTYNIAINRTFDKSIMYVTKYCNKPDNEPLYKRVLSNPADALNILPFKLSSQKLGFSFFDKFKLLDEDESVNLLISGVDTPFSDSKLSIPSYFKRKLTKREYTQGFYYKTVTDNVSIPCSINVSFTDKVLCKSTKTENTDVGEKYLKRASFASLEKFTTDFRLFVSNLDSLDDRIFTKVSRDTFRNINLSKLRDYVLNVRNILYDSSYSCNANPFILNHNREQWLLFETVYSTVKRYYNRIRKNLKILEDKQFVSKLPTVFANNPELFIFKPQFYELQSVC